MPFNTTSFFVFLAAVLVLFYALPPGLRKYLLLAASYFFYAFWNVKFLALLATLTAIDYTAGIWMETFPAGPAPPRHSHLQPRGEPPASSAFSSTTISLASNLALLLGRPPLSFWLDIVLPLGISFHTFQSMSYVVDVYRGEQEAVRNPIDYALFICFFPQLVAGPIVRACNFFHDLWNWRPPSPADVSRGLLLLALGLTKKMAFADQFAVVANTYFAHVGGNPGMLQAWCGVFAFGMQIYFDFSGYTDMAIGMAKLLGFYFPVNFRRPYLAASITDFWRRWHISLSTWLRDYLYIPLGGNRHGRWKTYRNLMLTMLLGGLWHGASWNFLIWGAYHGGLLALERAFRIRTLTVPVTFCLTLIGWVFFRAADLPQSLQVLGQMFSGAPGHMLLEPWHLGLASMALLLALLEEKKEWFDRLVDAPAWVYASALALMLFCAEIFGVVDASIPFIYFQF